MTLPDDFSQKKQLYTTVKYKLQAYFGDQHFKYVLSDITGQGILKTDKSGICLLFECEISIYYFCSQRGSE